MRIVVILIALVAVIGRPSPGLPRMAHPNPVENAEEVWQMTLPEAIRIGLNNSEVVRVIWIGAQEIPLGGFEPTPLGPDGEQPPAGSLSTVYDESLRAAAPGPDRP